MTATVAATTTAAAAMIGRATRVVVRGLDPLAFIYTEESPFRYARQGVFRHDDERRCI